MPTTRQKSIAKLESIVNRLEVIEQEVIALGLLYQDSDVVLSGCMYMISTMIEAALPLLRKAIKET